MSPTLQSWLFHAGPLTDKLRDFAGAAFHVQVLREATVALDAEEARLLDVEPGGTARLREVYLCGREPLVFGRTLTPLRGAARWLDTLGSEPLGARVFAFPGTRRSEIRVRPLHAPEPLYHAATAGLPVAPATVWARRSVLVADGHPLLIHECFLPGLTT